MYLIDKYEDKYKEYVGTDKEGYYDKINRPYKISGNVFSHFLRDEIYNIIKNRYDVSPVNSYIKGCNVEWDLLIIDKPTNEEKNYNIYLPEHVICAFEFKSSGAIMYNSPKDAVAYLNKEIEALKQCNKKIKYGYISLCEIPDNLNELENTFKNKCFWIIRDYYRKRNTIKKTQRKDLEEYINTLLK